MKVKTSELTDAALDWATGVAEGYELSLYGVDPSIRARVPGQGVIAPWRPTYYWNQGGPIIERERIVLDYYNHICDGEDQVYARLCRARLKPEGQTCWYAPSRGPTSLIAAMRCYCCAKIGDIVDVPEELCQQQSS